MSVPAGRPSRGLLTAAVLASVVLASIAVAVPIGSPSLLTGISVVTFLSVSAWMFFSERLALSLGALTLYLGLVDGYLKLRTGSQYATLARDVLLYAICLGLLARAFIRREDMRLPLYGGMLLVYVLLVVVQLANPGGGGLGHDLAALRPHLEFVPLFFLAYLAVRTKRRLRATLMLLVVIGAANGIVSFVQFGMTPEQLSSWGPGYASRIEGDTLISGRVFYDNSGEAHVRPFGLQDDSGEGGFVSLLALPAALALAALERGRRRWLWVLLALPIIVGIPTSQGRTVIIGAVVTLMAYLAMTVVARRLLPTLAAVVLIALPLIAATSLSGDPGGSGAFDRVAQIAPSSFLQSATEQRGSSVVLAPTYAAEFPFGAGLGSVGPAAGVSQSPPDLNGETEFNFLILELGVLGAGALLFFLGALIRRTFRQLRTISDPDLRPMLAALGAPLVGMVVMFFGTSVTAGSPGAPYLWAVAGVLAYWLGPARNQKRPARSNAS